MDYRKEQNFMVAYDEAGNMRGKWNITANEYIGVRGAKIKSKPVAFKLDNFGMPTYLYSALRIIADCNSYHPFTEAIGQRLEQVISLNLIVDYGWNTLNFLERDKTPLTKEVVQYLRDKCESVYSENNITNYRYYSAHKAFLHKCGEQENWAIEVIQNINRNDKNIYHLNDDFIEGMIIRGVHEKVFHTYRPYDYANLIKRWAKLIYSLNDTLEVKHNILTNFCILQYLEKQYRESHYDENLNRHNNLNWLYYENDSYIVRPLTNRAEFHAEAESQRNCVERMYMEYVANGETHVVVVRKKDNPNRSYITCEVSNDGKIQQYLYRCNERVNNEADCNFKREYQNHLYEAEK